MSGYIKLHRQLLDSFQFQNSDVLKVWIWMLLKAAHKEQIVAMGYTNVTLKKGEFIFGRTAASEELKLHQSHVYRLLKVLEGDGSIAVKSNNRFSIITICNFDSYNENENSVEQQMNNQRTTSEQPANTYKKDKKDKNAKNIELPKGNSVGLPAATPRTLSYEDRCKKFIDKFNSLKVVNKKPGKYQVTGLVRTKLKARLATYTPEQIIGAIKTALLDKNHIEKNWIYLTPEYILREEIIERYINADMTERQEYYKPGVAGSNDHTRFEPSYNPQD